MDDISWKEISRPVVLAVLIGMIACQIATQNLACMRLQDKTAKVSCSRHFLLVHEGDAERDYPVNKANPLLDRNVLASANIDDVTSIFADKNI